ncbi:hypothetical protein E2C01_046458 [Portunus trituberculatus]|uniref:Uncharacterized protein n=1 Tax=Portunus trituberculatus TaxID=210409 RepID=A0A5B7G4Y3_PORTR|nr:hypothetical protein [Portunus trituberculatus]
MYSWDDYFCWGEGSVAAAQVGGGGSEDSVCSTGTLVPVLRLINVVMRQDAICDWLRGEPMAQWYSGTMRALGSEGSPSARVRILSTV